MKKLWIALVTLACAAGTAQAHQIWLEAADGQGTVLRFGEFGENLREVSPGLLDKFVQPTATLVAGKNVKTSAQAVKARDAYTLPFQAGQGESIVAEETRYPLFSIKEGGKGWYHPAARLITDFSAQEPRLVLDLVPTGRAGEFRLYFQGKPKAKTKVTLVTQSGWAREAQTDAEGRVQFSLPWKGTYVAEVSHTERTPGERPAAGGPEKYDSVSYSTTLSYVQPEGLEPLPAGPAAAPYQSK
jgi:uncharacterized GH25 family protein